MWSASEEPSADTMEDEGPPNAITHTKETCQQNKNQLESLKEIMIKNQQNLRKKEEQVQEYAQRLSKIKSRAKLSRRSKEGGATSSSRDSMRSRKTESTSNDVTDDDAIDDISQAKTPKAKSSLLQRKLAENRKAFEQHNKELTETQRAVEEKVEAIRQQLDETDLTTTEIYKDQSTVTPILPIVVTSDVISPIQMQLIQEKENKIVELNSKILELEAIVLDLQENLKEKDSVIDSKTKAVTLMSADFSKKGKTTLDTLEDTKDEMRTMQENFVLIETSLKNKNANLLKQLQERDNQISDLEQTLNGFEKRVEKQKLADFSRSTMDTLAETKEEMKSMQENFVLIESSLKLKNDNLLQQLTGYEVKLAEANEKIFHLESGAGIVRTPAIEDLQFRIHKLEQNNKQLLDEKYELQKNIAEIQDKVITNRLVHGNDAIVEKDNRIVELENVIEQLERSSQLLKEESKIELQKQIIELSSNNEKYFNKIIHLEKQIREIEAEKHDSTTKSSEEQVLSKHDVKVIKLTKELEELNKSMIKLKAQHKSKVKNLQKQLENFKMVSDTNAELVRLGNQVALLEEEKGNLQLSLVDFDELKASAGDWQGRVVDLESKISTQTKEIQMHIDAIATLENQKLDLMQDLHAVKQQVSALEAENAESENLRVTAEMKIVDLEEQLEAIHKKQNESEYTELFKKISTLTQENSELYNRLNKIEEKGASDTGSTESFETIQVNDRNDLLKKIDELEQRNNELTLKLTKLEEKDNSQAGSTESFFEAINDMTDRSELLKKIEQLTQENSDLTIKLSRIEEKGSSDTGSTGSFERIPEHNENITKIELLTQENTELIIKLTKLEEQLSQIIDNNNRMADISNIDNSLETLKDDSSSRLQIETLTQENDDLMAKISKLKMQMEEIAEENNRLEDRVNVLTAENTDLIINRTKLEERLEAELSHTSEMSFKIIESTDHINVLTERQQALEKELEASVEQLVNVTSCETDDAKSKVALLEKENTQVMLKITQLEDYINIQKEEMNKIIQEKEELTLKLESIAFHDFAKERLDLIDQLEKLIREKESIVQEKQELHEQLDTLLQKSSNLEIPDRQEAADKFASQKSQEAIAALQKKVEKNKVLIAEYKNQVGEMNMKLLSMETELQEKTKQLAENENSSAKLENLESELKKMFSTAEEWKFKYDEMQIKIKALEEGKTFIEKDFMTLQSENENLLKLIREKDAATCTLQDQLQDSIRLLESKLENGMTNLAAKEQEIKELKADIQDKNQELHDKYAQLQNEMITIDNLQEELNNSVIHLKEKETAISSLLEEITKLNDIIKKREEQESLRITETNYVDLQNKHQHVLKEKDDLAEKIRSMSKYNKDIKDELIKKEQDIVSLLAIKKDVDTELEKIKNDKAEAEKRIWESQAILDNQNTYVEKMRSELTNEYKQMEQLKTKHTEDMDMLNRRLEDVMEQLSDITREYMILKNESKEEKESFKKYQMEQVNLKQKLLESENKLQKQSDKMKKIVATFNKKKVICQEFEERVVELEEKWMTEKNEKEAKQEKIQQLEVSLRNSNDEISNLEGKLLHVKSDIIKVLEKSETTMIDSSSLDENISALINRMAEMREEMDRSCAEINRVSLDLMTEKEAKENLIKEYEFCKQIASKENEQKQMILEEVKEEARELSVRMQVMETEYVEQLALIKNLKTENGLLSSKQTQINEKLENAEKESEERRLLIEQLQKEIATITAVQVSEEDVIQENDTRITQQCDHSEQCQNLVQALEARLQERQAEVENLNNELANSYGNIVLLHDESLRYNNMMMHRAQECFNQSLMDQTNTLQQQIDSLKLERTMNEQRIGELQIELDEYKQKNAEFETGRFGIVETSEITKVQQQQTQNIPQLFDASKVFGLLTVNSADADISDKKELVRLQDLLNEKENQCLEYIKQIDLLQKNIQEKTLSSSQAECDDQVRYAKNQFEDAQNELKKLELHLSERNAQVVSLNVELNNMNLQINELKMLQDQYHATKAALEKLEQVVTEKNIQIESLIMELKTVNQLVVNLQMEQHSDVDILQTEVSVRDTREIASLRTELFSTKETIEMLTIERDQQSRALELYKLEIEKMKTEIGNVNEHDLKECQQRIHATTTERDLLQLQVNDLTRTLEELKESLVSQRNLQIELENAVREKIQAQLVITNLTQVLENSQQSFEKSGASEKDFNEQYTSIEKTVIQEKTEKVLMPVEETISQQENIQLAAQTPVQKAVVQETPLDIDLNWDNASEKLYVDEESWGWNVENAQVVSDQHLSTMTLIPNNQVLLRAQVEDLQDQIKDLETQNIKITEESKTVQIKNGKLVKKLKEYKIQVENLQQQLKTQMKQTDNFFDLDMTIEKELEIQIANLEKALNEIKEEKKYIIAEKDALLKRLDAITSANERYMEMKTKQDMEIETLHIRNKDLDNKVQSLQWQLQADTSNMKDTSLSLSQQDQTDNSGYEIDTSIPSQQPQNKLIDDFKIMSRKYKEEIDELKDELEALATENEQLQHFLENQKAAMINLESKRVDNTEELREKIDDLTSQNTQLQGTLHKTKEEYNVLRKQYEQTLMDANEQVLAIRQNSDLLRIEFSEKVEKLETEINNSRQQAEISDTKAVEMQNDLQKAVQEKDDLESKLNALMNSEKKLSTVNTSLMEVSDLLNTRVQEVADLKQELQNQYIERQEAEALLQSEIQSLIKELNEAKQQLEALTQVSSDKEHQLIQQKSMDTASAIVSEATQELVQKHAIEIEEKNKKLHKLTVKLTMLQSTIDEYISKLQDNTAQSEIQQQQIAYLKEDLTERDSIIEMIKTEINSMKQRLQEKQQELVQCEEDKYKLTVQVEKLLSTIQHLESRLSALEATSVDLEDYNLHVHYLKQAKLEIQNFKSEKESDLLRFDQETNKYQTQLENYKEQIDNLKQDLREETKQLHYVNTQLCAKESDLERITALMNDKDSLLETVTQELNEKQAKLEKLHKEQPLNSNTIDNLPVFKMDNNDDMGLQSIIIELKAQMVVKQQELEHLKHVLNDNTYPTIIQEMQDKINCLYDEKTTLESSLRSTTQSLTEKQEQINLLTQRGQDQEHISKEEISLLSRSRRSVHDQQEIVKLQNELHTKEQEINELKYIITEKDSQLCLQASMEPQSDDFELRETVQRLTGQLYGREQEVQTLKSTIAGLEGEILHLKDLERLSEESRNAIKELTSEKEQIRIEAQEFLNKELQKKELEIDEIKQRLSKENQKLLTELSLKDDDIKNLRMQMEQLQDDWSNKLRQKESKFMYVNDDLLDTDRRLAELNITKDAELYNLKVQIREKEARIEEIMTLSAEEERQLDELRQTLVAKETEIVTLKELLEQKVSEFELLQHALKKDVSVIEAALPKTSGITQTDDNKEATSSELDLALYMLHQRDVRCEELTHELMQLLEERDTLQLQLSHAIRMNEELRKTGNFETIPTEESLTMRQTNEPVVEQPSPSKSEGPVEIAKEAIDTPIDDKKTLALKLSQLHSISHTKDVRLKDERELRHTQQMSLLAHRDDLNRLPPEATARLNANHTLSRDVQSQSSVLLNWFWGKSTPKVIHM